MSYCQIFGFSTGSLEGPMTLDRPKTVIIYEESLSTSKNRLLMYWVYFHLKDNISEDWVLNSDVCLFSFFQSVCWYFRTSFRYILTTKEAICTSVLRIRNLVDFFRSQEKVLAILVAVQAYLMKKRIKWLLKASAG